MLRSLLILASLYSNLSLQAEVSKDFLVNLHSKFKSSMGFPVQASDFRKELNEEELSFLEQSQMHDYRDIFYPTLPKDKEVYSYNLFHFRGLSSIITEWRLHGDTKCEMVETEDGIHFVSHKLEVFRNPPAEEGVKKWRFSYCVGSEDNSDNESVLFYFHGAAGNPYNWVQRDATYALRKRWRQTGRLPRWISVSLGSIGHMGEIGREQKFFEIIVPYIEKAIGFNERPKMRFGFGISQGGANVVHAVLKKEGFFDAAVAVCPAILAVPPYANKEEIARYRKRTRASRLLINFALNFVPHEFLKPDYWDQNVDALMLGQRYLNENSTPLYIQTSVHDQLGLQEGGQIFAMLARTKGAPVMFEELEGKHCVLRPRKIADFFRSFQNGELPLQLKMLGRTRR